VLRYQVPPASAAVGLVTAVFIGVNLNLSIFSNFPPYIWLFLAIACSQNRTGAEVWFEQRVISGFRREVYLTPEDGTDRLSRNVSKLPNNPDKRSAHGLNSLHETWIVLLVSGKVLFEDGASRRKYLWDKWQEWYNRVCVLRWLFDDTYTT
jgi:hypothetical protein